MLTGRKTLRSTNCGMITWEWASPSPMLQWPLLRISLLQPLLKGTDSTYNGIFETKIQFVAFDGSNCLLYAKFQKQVINGAYQGVSVCLTKSSWTPTLDKSLSFLRYCEANGHFYGLLKFMRYHKWFVIALSIGLAILFKGMVRLFIFTIK